MLKIKRQSYEKSLDTCKNPDIRTGAEPDKDRLRRSMHRAEKAEKAYHEVLKRLVGEYDG